MAGYKFRNRKRFNEINMIPVNLIDVVIILLIFFILTSTFKKETGVKIERPSATKVFNLKNNAKQNTLTITGENELLLNKQTIAIADLNHAVKKIMESEKASIVIISDKKSDVGVLIKILDMFNINGFKNYSIAVEKEK